MSDNATKECSFIPLTEFHFPLLLKWLQAPHVKAWWDRDIDWTPQLIQEKYSDYTKGFKLENDIPKQIKPYIIGIDDKPIGYIQLYNAHDFLRNKALSMLPKNLGAFDIFIGDEKYLKKNIGSKAIAKFFNQFAQPYSHIFVESDADNLAAIKCYEKAGFKRLSGQNDTNDVGMLWENKVVGANNAEHYVWGEGCDGWWLKKDERFTAIEERMPPGSLELKHFHNITEQFFYVLNGTLCIEMNDIEYQLQNNQGLTIPAGAVHQVFNKSKEPARFLVISCPDSHGDRVNVEDVKAYSKNLIK